MLSHKFLSNIKKKANSWLRNPIIQPTAVTWFPVLKENSVPRPKWMRRSLAQFPSVIRIQLMLSSCKCGGFFCDFRTAHRRRADWRICSGSRSQFSLRNSVCVCLSWNGKVSGHLVDRSLCVCCVCVHVLCTAPMFLSMPGWASFHGNTRARIHFRSASLRCKASSLTDSIRLHAPLPICLFIYALFT